MATFRVSTEHCLALSGGRPVGKRLLRNPGEEKLNNQLRDTGKSWLMKMQSLITYVTRLGCSDLKHLQVTFHLI